MDEKPAFWDFLNAQWSKSYYSNFLKIYDRKSGTIVEYYKPEGKPERIRLLVYIISLFLISFYGVFIVIFDWHPNIGSDFFTVVMLVYFSLNIMLNKISYYKTTFEKVPEPDWEWSIERKAKKRRRILPVIGCAIFILMMIYVWMNSYSTFCIRYIVEGGARNGTASVTIGLPEHNITLDENTPEGAAFSIEQPSGDDEIIVEIDTAKIPGQTSVYLNGEKLEPSVLIFPRCFSGRMIILRTGFFATPHLISLKRIIRLK